MTSCIGRLQVHLPIDLFRRLPSGTKGTATELTREIQRCFRTSTTRFSLDARPKLLLMA